MLRKKYLLAFLVNTNHPSRSDDFNIKGIPKGYSEPSRTSKMELFAKNSWRLKSLTISAKTFIIDVRLSAEYVSASFFPGTVVILLGKEVSQEKSWENEGINFGKCLVKLCRISYYLYQKNLYIMQSP